jgi:hypothetical protein
MSSLHPFIVISMIGGLFTLLGSVGIFISIIIQRKVERLQAILEEFIDLSYKSDLNLSGNMYNLIEKYQMHYHLPDTPRSILQFYINITLGLVIFLWLSLYFISYDLTSFSFFHLLYLLPLVLTAIVMFWFRKLFQYLINIDETPLLGSIIPPPKKLRSISYLSSFINVSVKSVLKQARLSLVIKKCDFNDPTSPWTVLLKEELSFDDFFYHLIIFDDQDPLFFSFGEILFDFPCDGITGKPSPIRRNINVPLGDIKELRNTEELKATLLIFTMGEKYPLNYQFKLKQGSNFFAPSDNPEVSIDHQIIYSILDDKIKIIKNDSSLPYLDEFKSLFKLNNTRLYLPKIPEGRISKEDLKTSHESPFVD